MTVFRDISELRDDLESAGGLPAWRTPSTAIGRQVQTLARALRDRWVKAELAATTVRAEIAKHAAEVDAQRATNERLTAEIERLRALPVIATCGACRFHSSAVAAMAGPFHNVVGGDYCSHERASGDDCDPDAAPPSWCPLRGKR